MKKKKNKSKKNVWESVILYSLGIIFIFILALLIISNIKIYKRRNLLREQVAEKTKQLEDLQMHDNQEDYLYESNDFIIEKIAREQLLLKKEGEEAVVVQSPKKENEEEIQEEEQQIIWWNPLTWKLRD